MKTKKEKQNQLVIYQIKSGEVKFRKEYFLKIKK